MKKFYLFVYILFLFCVISCGDGNRPQSASNVVIDLDSIEKRELPVELYLKEYILLETTDESVLGPIQKIQVKKGRIFVLDQRKRALSVFSEADGKYLFALDKFGRGPGEYLNIQDFDVDENLNIHILSSESFKIIQYKYPEYVQYETIPIDTHIGEICIRESSTYYIADYFTDNYRMSLGELKDHKINTIFKPREHLDNLQKRLVSKRNSLYFCYSSTLFNPRYSPDLFEIKDGKIVPLLSLTSENRVTERNANYMTTTPYQPTTQTMNGFTSVYRVGDIVWGKVWYSMPKIDDIFLYDLNTGKATLCSIREAKMGFFSDLVGAGEDYFVMTVMPTFVIQRYKEPWNEDIFYPLSTLSIDENANPILLKIGVK